jgi:hypothetical protein
MVEESMVDNDIPQDRSAEAAEHAKLAAKHFVLTLKSLLPDKFWEHGAEFGRESALAVQAAVESAIAALERSDAGGSDVPPTRPTRKARIEVD